MDTTELENSIDRVAEAIERQNKLMEEQNEILTGTIKTIIIERKK